MVLLYSILLHPDFMSLSDFLYQLIPVGARIEPPRSNTETCKLEPARCCEGRWRGPFLVVCFFFPAFFWIFYWRVPNPPVLTSEIPRRGRSQEGRCANVSQLARQICAKLPAFRFVHLRKSAQHCRKLVANLKVNFDNFMQIPLFQCPLLENSDLNPGAAERVFRACDCWGLTRVSYVQGK